MRRSLAVLVSFLIALNVILIPTPAFTASDYSTIRVKLSSMGTKTSVPVTVRGGYAIKEDSSIQLEQKTYTVRMENGKLVLVDGSKSWNLGSKITFQRNHGNLRINNTSYGSVDYPGDMEFRVEDKSISLINHVHLELYLYGVVPSEMPNNWHVEALKAQTIAARTYAADKMNARAKQAYDIVDTQSDQVYKGYNKNTARSIQAVDNTMGQVLKYGNSFAQTFYSSSNGGKTERAGNIFSRDLSYLIVKDDPYDTRNPSNSRATWTITYKKSPVDSALEKKIRENIKGSLGKRGYSTADADITVKSLKEFNVDYNDGSRLDKGRLVVVLEASKNGTVETIEETINLTKDNTRSFLGLHSLLFTVDNTEDAIVIKGGGFGHGVGMSQYGASQMANEGMSFSEILSFYYPGTKLVSLGINAPQHPDYIPPGSSPTPTPAPKPTNPPTSYGRVKVNTSLNIRKGAGTQHGIIGSLKNNARVEIIGESGQWYKIKTGNLTGYVSKDYIVLESQPSNPAPTPTPPSNPPPPTDPALPPDQEKRTAVVTASALNIRSGPGTKNHKVGMVVKGKQITVYEKTGNWYRVSYNGINGYVDGSYIKIQQSQTPVTPAPNSTGIVTAGSLNVRSGAGTGYRIVAGLKRNTKVEILSSSGSWYRIRYGNLTGYVSGQYLNIGQQPDRGSSARHGTVTASSLNVRFAAGTGYRIVGGLKRNTKVEILSSSGKWYRIRYGKLTGYVHGDYLKLH